MVVVLILMITTVWNDYLIGLTFGGIGAKPMTVILANSVITSRGEVIHNVNMAALLTAIPPLVVDRAAILRPGHHRRRDQGVSDVASVCRRRIGTLFDARRGGDRESNENRNPKKGRE